MSGGYGIGPYGLSPYGIGSLSLGYFIELAYLISANELVVITSEPMNLLEAVNPNEWTVRDDTANEVIVVYGVNPIGPNSVILYLQRPPAPLSHDFVVASDVSSSTGDTLDPNEYAFQGVNLASSYTQIGQQRRDFDFANPFLTSEKVPSTMSVGSSGDYNLVSGEQLVVKLVIRRLVTSPGEFVFLPASYGQGLKVNAPLYVSDLARLKTQIQNSLLREQELEAVAVAVRLDATTGKLSVDVRGKLKRTNAPFSIDFPVSSDTISFS